MEFIIIQFGTRSSKAASEWGIKGIEATLIVVNIVVGATWADWVFHTLLLICWDFPNITSISRVYKRMVPDRGKYPLSCSCEGGEMPLWCQGSEVRMAKLVWDHRKAKKKSKNQWLQGRWMEVRAEHIQPWSCAHICTNWSPNLLLTNWLTEITFHWLNFKIFLS